MPAERPRASGFVGRFLCWAHLSAQLLDGLVLSAEASGGWISEQLEALGAGAR